MKKLIYALPLLVLGGCQVLKDGAGEVETRLKAAPQLVTDALHALLSFVMSAFGAGLDLVIHKFLPF